ncbi:MAG TPA: class I SAM-dependent methyltransferase [Candidatus Paceibacterota bacterium]|nr:class I SAM-dependent methyltransferase [Candidatus Paceibacterota bacterium]HOL53763.1 class I SAM-dependent methyltransferase [Candidatus Paceibacterota bacterium]HON21698.1 class I SAM-dependent methyltransferase [Candidatus Paceibacterota bacterium]HPP16837.1 class I SAM-dependent methyltransferase [Candidatus Paceibacterota bacterium]HRU33489.1 class I SAM-dependent methyltransferase [Candidatus Paceibacterota bacterium]
MAQIFNPKVLVSQLNIAPGATVADFGCGSGILTLELARAVGDEGKVFAIDVVPQQLESVKSLAQMRGVNNIETRWANLEKTSTLDSESCDWVIIANLLFQVEKKLRPNIIEEAYKILKPEGKLVVIDWKVDSTLGPPKENRLTLEEIQKITQSQHFKFVRTLEIADTHWCALFQK